MQQKRDEEQNPRRNGQAQDHAVAPRGIAGVELGRQRNHNPKGDQKQDIVQPNLDAEDSSELDLGSQRFASNVASLPPLEYKLNAHYRILGSADLIVLA